eukprot:scaffold74473_cov17-Tisochrysis_lutea.AAC.1
MARCTSAAPGAAAGPPFKCLNKQTHTHLPACAAAAPGSDAGRSWRPAADAPLLLGAPELHPIALSALHQQRSAPGL